MPSILFVCTANICRSPMAACLMKKKLAEFERSRPMGTSGPMPVDEYIGTSMKCTREWRVESAGTWGMDGSDMSESVRQVLEEIGIDPGSHSARTVTREMLNAFDLILTMEKGQKEAIMVEFTETAERVYMLSEMIGERSDIRDPIGGPLSEFRQAAKTIGMILDQGFNKIINFIGDRD